MLFHLESGLHVHVELQEGAEKLLLTWWQLNQLYWLLSAAQAWPGSVSITGKARGGVIWVGPKSFLEFQGQQGPDYARRCFWLYACLDPFPAFPVRVGC